MTDASGGSNVHGPEVGSDATLEWTLEPSRPGGALDRRRDERPDVQWPVRPGLGSTRASDATGGSGVALRFAPGCKEDSEVRALGP